MVDSGFVGSEQLAWSGRDWRMPVWLWVGLATMFVSVLHIVIDFGVGLFDLHGTLSLTEATTLVGVALIQLWWAISFMAGARGNGSGVASAGILGAGWAALTNGFPIVYCPPVCEEARPLTDLGHVGSIVFGILLAVGRHLVAVARAGAPGLVHADRCRSLGGRDGCVTGEHPDHLGAPTAVWT